ncbi:MAG: hypothetical protein VX751_02330, partial [Pseudomonadota bacterium]|nr:hypothetical protein [Pseudomonadota bacterium]
ERINHSMPLYVVLCPSAARHLEAYLRHSMDFLQDHKMGQSGQAVWSGILRQEVFPHLELPFY